jgi:iron complex outermembrane recepter protein
MSCPRPASPAPFRMKTLTTALFMAGVFAATTVTVTPTLHAQTPAASPATPATSAPPLTAARYALNIIEQPLAETLRAVGRATSTNILFDPKTINGKTAKAIKGTYTAEEALTTLIEKEPLEVRKSSEGTLVVKVKNGDIKVEEASSKGNPTNPIQLAQASSATGSNAGASDAAPVSRSITGEENKKSEPTKIEKIEVTGSRVKRVEAEGALPVNVYTRQDIERSGQPNLSGFLNGLNEVSLASTSEAGFGGRASAGASAVQLRGLPVGTTLVLLNGRRLQDSGLSGISAFFNLDVIPFSAIERVEILPTGSSAVYGGDALAGVVNIILKKSAEGWAVDARYGGAKGTEDGSLSLVTGSTFERGSFLLVGVLNKKTPLTGNERDFFKDADYRRFGGPDIRSRGCTPGTVSSTTTANLPGLNSTLAGIPVVSSGQPLTISSFVQSAGVPNLCSSFAQGYGLGLIWDTEVASIHATADYRLGGTWSAIAELTYSRTKQLGLAQGLFLGSVTVPASNPYNPFGVPVRVTSRLSTENGANGTQRETNFSRALIGVRGELTLGWDAELTASTAFDKSTGNDFNSVVNLTARAAALTAASASAALNPFATSRAASDEVLRSIWSDGSVDRNNGSRDLLSGLLRGAAFELPAGPIDVVAGVELGRDKWASGNLFDARRNTKAQFVEARVPLMLSQSQVTKTRELAALTLAGRRDDYSGIGSANTYQLGLEVRPTSGLLLRAARATSFKPPSLYQQNPLASTADAGLFGLTDPLRGNALITAGEVIIGAPNPLLGSERGKADTLGVVWESDYAPGLRLGLTNWRMVLTDNIVQPGSLQFFLTYESLFPGYVERAPSVGGVPGVVTRIRYSFINLGKVEVSGNDLDLAYTLSTAFGKWNFSGSATRTGKYDVVVNPNSPTENRLGNRNTEAWAPKWKRRLSVGFDQSTWSMGLTSRYLGSYKDLGTNPRDLGDFWIYDIFASADLKKLAAIGGMFKKAIFTAGIVNVANKLPEYVNSSPFFDTTQGDWRGRYFNVRLSLAW